ncbi:Mitotic checkpoint serine/threonine-protein kinase BUB1 [Camponotus japonicus]
MDPATVIALCKENIQPLRYGRNATQLGTALRAQEDADAQQLLLQEKQMYEDAIKNYEGDDPLENWYEYILWVEQSYPKSGHESHIGRLLQQCLSLFEKETKYHQDRRYIRLWINYISMQKNPLELYQLLHNNGIGTRVADMYRAWAFELEQIEDDKRADEVYIMGLTVHAEPYDELSHAHQNFQIAVARKTLGRIEERNDVSLFEQRQAFSSLKAIRAGKRVGSIRTGHRVRDYYPGVVPQISTSNAKSNSKIQIYQDDTPGEIKGSILDHVPIEDSVHKENTIKPGPWSSASKRGPLIAPTVKTGFKIHEDESDDADMEKIKLFSNHVAFCDGSKCHDSLRVPVYVADAIDPNIVQKPCYPKELVYADNVDRSMEEIRAQLYFERRAQLLESKHEISMVCSREIDSESQSQLSNYENIYHLQEIEEQKLNQQRREAEINRQRLQTEQQELQRQYEVENQVLETQRQEAERRELERLEAERLEVQRIEAELNTQRKLQSSNQFMHQHHTSSLAADAEEHLLGQSLTVNTKEAISVVQGLWQSPDTTLRFRHPVAPRIVDSRNKLPFDIHMDGSMTQHAMSSNKPHHQGYNVQIYNDQENHQGYHTQHHSYSGQEQHAGYANHSLQNSYYQMQQHHDHQVQQSQHHPRQHHPQHHQQQHQMIPSHQQMHTVHHQPLSHPQHLQSPHGQMSHHQPHIHHHQSPHNQHILHSQQPQHMPQHMQHIQHPVYGNILPTDIGYQQYPTSPPMETPAMLQQNIEPQKQLHFSPYNDSDIETNKPYRMPPELPYIKSPGMNRKDIKYLESAENKENAIVVDYNGPLEENMVPKLDENNLYIDESLGITPLSTINETCYTEAFNTHLTSSTPMTNHFKPSYRMKDDLQFSSQNTIPPIAEAPNVEGDDKLSVILESTREYVSSSSSSNNYTKTTGLTFGLTREDMAPIKEQSVDTIVEEESNEAVLSANQPYEQKLRAQIQAVHAQSPRTVQRNVDQITSEIQNNCDLRKSINLQFNNEEENSEKVDTMDCEEHEPMEQMEEELSFELPSKDINPFDKNLIAGLLKKIKFPQPQHADGYTRIDTNLNKLVPSTMITLGTEAYDLEKCLGKGMYGTVFKAVNIQTGETVALKTQRPAWIWEYYIVREIKTRLTNPHMLRGFMDVTMAYVANNGSVLVSEYSKFGTLLAVTNQIKIATGKPLMETVAIFFTIEMLQIVEYLHNCQIIHGDIKPDNFLLMRLPTQDVRPTIQLIDFGCSIDMKLLPENTTFTQVIKTEDFTCIEMQTGRPWTYQTDLYCLAATSHCLLFGNYMKVSNVGGRWFIASKLPRYAKKAAWEQFFTELLNIESCEKMPDLAKLRNMMEETLAQMSEAQAKFRTFVNILNRR